MRTVTITPQKVAMERAYMLYLNIEGRPPEPTELEPCVLQAALGFLLRRYLRNRHPRTARLVVRQVEKLLAHPQFREPPAQRCLYRRLAKHWDCLAMGTAESLPSPVERGVGSGVACAPRWRDGSPSPGR